MRVALLIGLCALLVTVLPNDRSVGERGRRGMGRIEPVYVAAYAKGYLLPMARQAPGAIERAGGMRVGSLSLLGDETSSGLHVVTLSQRFEPLTNVTLDCASSLSDAREFVERVGHSPERTVLVVASSGRIRPSFAGGDAVAVDLLRAARALGSEVDPFADSPTSWALIAVRLEDGWVKLAESFSSDSGVPLAFTLDPDLGRYADHRGETLRARLDSGREIALYLELPSAEQGSGARLRRAFRVGGKFKSAIYAPIPTAVDSEPRSSIVWRDVDLGDAPRFETEVGLRDGSWPASDGVVFSVWIDAVRAGEFPLGVDGPPPSPTWQPWSLDLAAWAGRRVSLELRVDPNGTSEADRALWGEPRLMLGNDTVH